MYIESDLSKALRVSLAGENKSSTWLAKELGVTPQYINQVCNGDKQLNMKRTNQVCKALNIKLSTFVARGE